MVEKELQQEEVNKLIKVFADSELTWGQEQSSQAKEAGKKLIELQTQRKLTKDQEEQLFSLGLVESFDTDDF